MPTPITVPKLGESVTSAILVRWLKQAGEKIDRDEAVCELETDKANVDVPATAAGVLRTLKQPGDTVAIGEAIAMVDGAGVASAAPSQPAASRPATSQPAAVTADAGSAAKPPTTAPSASVPAPVETVPPEDLSPAVRVLVAENGLDAAALQKTAPGGRLTKEFVTSYLSSRDNGGGGNGVRDDGPSKNAPPTTKTATVAQGATQTSGAASIPPPAGKGASERITTDPNAIPKDFDANGERRVAISKIREVIARRLLQAQQTAAILTTFNEVDLTEVMSLRTKYKEIFEKTHGVGLGFMSFFARAVVMGLKEFPRINAFLDGKEIVYHKHVHLGIAVSTDRGLTVPVLRNVDTMGFSRIESEIKRMATAARDNKLSIDELSGGTFSITNGGVFGSMLSTPILNPPQSGILGMHAIQRRPVAIGDKIEIRPMMYLALSYDHRLVDGKESISFLVRVKQCLEDPARLMLEV